MLYGLSFFFDEDDDVTLQVWVCWISLRAGRLNQVCVLMMTGYVDVGFGFGIVVFVWVCCGELVLWKIAGFVMCIFALCV
jgi:hypothetical protein